MNTFFGNNWRFNPEKNLGIMFTEYNGVFAYKLAKMTEDALKST